MADISTLPIELTICLDSCFANDNAEFTSIVLCNKACESLGGGAQELPEVA